MPLMIQNDPVFTRICREGPRPSPATLKASTRVMPLDSGVRPKRKRKKIQKKRVALFVIIVLIQGLLHSPIVFSSPSSKAPCSSLLSLCNKTTQSPPERANHGSPVSSRHRSSPLAGRSVWFPEKINQKRRSTE